MLNESLRTFWTISSMFIIIHYHKVLTTWLQMKQFFLEKCWHSFLALMSSEGGRIVVDYFLIIVEMIKKESSVASKPNSLQFKSISLFKYFYVRLSITCRMYLSGCFFVLAMEVNSIKHKQHLIIWNGSGCKNETDCTEVNDAQLCTLQIDSSFHSLIIIIWWYFTHI